MQMLKRRLLKPRTQLLREGRMEIPGLNDEHEELRTATSMEWSLWSAGGYEYGIGK